jgi:hypothetical protein
MEENNWQLKHIKIPLELSYEGIKFQVSYNTEIDLRKGEENSSFFLFLEDTKYQYVL